MISLPSTLGPSLLSLRRTSERTRNPQQRKNPVCLKWDEVTSEPRGCSFLCTHGSQGFRKSSTEGGSPFWLRVRQGLNCWNWVLNELILIQSTGTDLGSRDQSPCSSLFVQNDTSWSMKLTSRPLLIWLTVNSRPSFLTWSTVLGSIYMTNTVSKDFTKTYLVIETRSRNKRII